jgi:hypothetical protein
MFRTLWKWLNSPKCQCGQDAKPICHSYENKHKKGRGDQCLCGHSHSCHLEGVLVIGQQAGKA